MSLRLEIRNFRGVPSASLALAGVTLLAGRNGAGKTSTCQALSSVLTGSVPVGGLKKSDLERLVSKGARFSEVLLEHAEGETASRARMTYPDAKFSTAGTPPGASAVASGMASPLEMTAKDAAASWLAVLDADPSEDDLRIALEEVPGMSAAVIASVWAAVQTVGWDGAHAKAREQATKAKGRWEQITGDRYGSKKATTWEPAEWTADLQEADLAKLLEDEVAASAALERALKADALDADQRARLQALAGELDARNQAHADAKAAAKAAREEWLAAEALKLPDPSNTMACPHCGGMVMASGAALVVVEQTPEELAELSRQLEEHRVKVRELEATQHRLAGEAIKADLAVKDSAKAAWHLNREEPGTDCISVDEARANYNRALARITAAKSKRDADQAAAEARRGTGISAVLAPEGLRARKMREALAGLNAELETLSAAAGWPLVSIGDDFGCTCGGLPYALLSESEQYRCRALVQALIGHRDGSRMLVFDRADLLDRAGRNGLLKLAKYSSRMVVIAMTMDSPADVPDLKAKRLGVSYWIENGNPSQIG